MHRLHTEYEATGYCDSIEDLFDVEVQIDTREIQQLIEGRTMPVVADGIDVYNKLQHSLQCRGLQRCCRVFEMHVRILHACVTQSVARDTMRGWSSNVHSINPLLLYPTIHAA